MKFLVPSRNSSHRIDEMLSLAEKGLSEGKFNFYRVNFLFAAGIINWGNLPANQPSS